MSNDPNGKRVFVPGFQGPVPLIDPNRPKVVELGYEMSYEDLVTCLALAKKIEKPDLTLVIASVMSGEIERLKTIVAEQAATIEKMTTKVDLGTPDDPPG